MCIQLSKNIFGLSNKDAPSTLLFTKKSWKVKQTDYFYILLV